MRKWTDEEVEELERTHDPDWDSVEWFPPSLDRGAVVAVRLGSTDFQRIARCAEERGEKITDFFRSAAIERAERLEVMTGADSGAGPPANGQLPESIQEIDRELVRIRAEIAQEQRRFRAREKALELERIETLEQQR
jgi:hypothetical protein